MKKYAGRVLEIEEENVKALYRRGIAHLNLEDFDQCKEDLLSAYELQPKNRDIKEALALYKERKKGFYKREAELAKTMFSEREAQESLRD